MGLMLKSGFIIVIFKMISLCQGNKAKAAICKPWAIPVAVDPINHNHRPFYIELHRCMGQCQGNTNSPLKCECKAKTTQDVNVQIVTQKGQETRTFTNHTSCASQCHSSHKDQCLRDNYKFDDLTCSCQCPTSKSCPPNFHWNSQTCHCECSPAPQPCPDNREWNKSSCSCQCSLSQFTKCSRMNLATDLQKCHCRKRPVVTAETRNRKGDASQTKLVSLVAICTLLGILFVIDLILMFNKKGFMYSLTNSCIKKKEKEITYKVDAETASISLDVYNDSPVQNGSCKNKIDHSQYQLPTSL